jgi:hypothetical protein
VTRAEVERLLDLIDEADDEQARLTMKLIGEVLAASVLEMPFLLEDAA